MARLQRRALPGTSSPYPTTLGFRSGAARVISRLSSPIMSRRGSRTPLLSFRSSRNFDSHRNVAGCPPKSPTNLGASLCRPGIASAEQSVFASLRNLLGLYPEVPAISAVALEHFWLPLLANHGALRASALYGNPSPYSITGPLRSAFHWVIWFHLSRLSSPRLSLVSVLTSRAVSVFWNSLGFTPQFFPPIFLRLPRN